LKNIPFNDIINHDNVVLENFSFGNITGIAVVALVAILICICMKVAEFFLIIYASVKTSNGEDFKYPVTIPFIK
jgi:hypothetical protein